VPQPKRSQFDRAEVEAHILAKHPSCPAEIRAAIVEKLAGRTWEEPLTLGKAFGIVATNHIRHQHTDYERLLREEQLPRDVAREAVRKKLNAKLKAWRRRPV
jgi:hypothetical protein